MMITVFFLLLHGIITNTQVSFGDFIVEDHYAFASALREFSQSFYIEAAKQGPDNFVFSPLSLHSVLSILYKGASPDSTTFQELETGLGSASSPDIIENGTRNILTQLNSDEAFTFINKLWLAENQNLQTEFESTLNQSFLAQVEKIDFAKPGIERIVNDWITTLTKGVIDRMVDDVSPLTQLLITNGLFFNLSWGVEFQPTKQRFTFHLPTDIGDSDSSPQTEAPCRGEEILADEYENATAFMRSRPQVYPDLNQKELDYFQNSSYSCVPMIQAKKGNIVRDYIRLKNNNDYSHEVFSIPYENTDYVMKIILPNKRFGNKGLETLEQELGMLKENMIFENEKETPTHRKRHGNIFEAIMDDYLEKRRLELDRVNFRMPKFEMVSKINVVDVLQKLGVKKVFTGNAELGNIFNASRTVKVGKVRHSAAIKVDEKGTEAAAASTVEIVFLSAVSSTNKNVVIDRPFLFAVMDKKKKLPLLVGRVTDPSVLNGST